MRILAIDLSILVYTNAYVQVRDGDPEKLNCALLERNVRHSLRKLRTEYFMRNNGKRFQTIVLGDSLDNWRNSVDPDYKGGRRKEPNAFKERVSHYSRFIARNISADYPYLEHLLLEADDWAFMLSRCPEQVTLVTNDDDYLCMINETTKVFQFSKKKLVTLDNFDVGSEIVRKIVKGCKTDSITPAYTGVFTRKMKETVSAAYHIAVSEGMHPIDALIAAFDCTKHNEEKLDRELLRRNYYLAGYDLDHYPNFLGTSNFDQVVTELRSVTGIEFHDLTNI